MIDRKGITNMYYRYIGIMFLGLLLSCKESHEVKPATYSLMLTGEESKSWQQVSFTFIFDDPEVEDFDANLIYGIPDCALDDIYTYFREGKQLEVFDGNQKCDPEGDDLLFRTNWDIVNANASFFVGNTDDPFILSKLTDDSLVYGFRDTLVAPIADQTFWEYPGEARWVYTSVN